MRRNGSRCRNRRVVVIFKKNNNNIRNMPVVGSTVLGTTVVGRS